MSSFPPPESDPWSAQSFGGPPQYGVPGPPSQANPQTPGYPSSYGSVPSVPWQPEYAPPSGYGPPQNGAPGYAPGYGFGYPSAAASQPMPPIGYPPMMAYTPGMPMPMAPVDPGRGMAIAGMVVGIIGLVLFWAPACLLGWPLAILGIVFSAIGMRSKTARGMAIAGLVCSILTFVFTVGMYLIIAVLGSTATTGA